VPAKEHDGDGANFDATIRLSDHNFLKRVGYFGYQKSFCVILDE